jgi:hypothetical protein
MNRIRLEVLDVREPCTEDWRKMTGDDRVRFCGTCRLDVYDLSALTTADAEELVNKNDGSLCVRFYRRADGTVTTLDCAPRRFEKLRRGARVGLGFGALLVAGALSIVGALGVVAASDASEAVHEWADKVVEPHPVIMGAMPLPEPPPSIDEQQPVELPQ